MTPEETLKHYFGYEKFRPAQKEIIEAILNGKNLVTVLPTGGGKSVCYQVPALMMDNFSIVISPLIALMKDQVDSINQSRQTEKNASIAAFINSTLSFPETEEVFRKIQSKEVKLLYLAPERLENLSFAERIKNLSPEFLFIDEAHCISEWGHNFRPSYRKIKDFAQYIVVNKISAFTATATPEVIKDIINQLELHDPQVFVKGFERENLSISVIKTKKKKEECFNLITRFKTPAIIYASSRKRTEEIAEFLNLYKLNAAYYHAGMAPEERKHVQELFIKDKIKIITATTAFGMGIDKSDIRLIIHYNMPGSIEGYYQEIGRAGRDGKESYAFLLYEDSDKYIHKYFIANSYPEKDLIKNIYNAICDFGSIAVGSFSENEIPVSLEFISAYTKQKVSSAMLSSALGILEQAGYIKNISELEKRTYLQFNLDQARLKEYVKNIPGNEVKDIILLLLREYGSRIINSKISVSPGNLSELFGFSHEYIDSLLTQLCNYGILDYTKPVSGKSAKLTVPRVADNYLYIDHRKIAEAYNNSLSKLNSVIDFVYTAECRMKFIISYFGEDEKEFSCRKCDNCSDHTNISNNSNEYIAELIRNTAAELNGKLSDKGIVNILLGKSEIFCSTTGSCMNYSHDEIQSVMDSLFSKEVLIRQNNGKIFIKEKSGEPEKVHDENLFDYENHIELYNKLREVRKKVSERFQQSSYLVCPDEVLRLISEVKPENQNQLLAIKGFSQRMFNKIGLEFLEEIKEHRKAFNQTNSSSAQKKELPQSISETYNLLLKGYPLKDIASLRKLTPAVISMQIETIIEYQPGIDISNLFSGKKIELIQQEITKGYLDLKELKSRLPAEIEYSEIRIVMAKIKTKTD